MIHLHTHTWYSFLGGASSPWELVQAAVAAGQRALAVTDSNTLAGAVDFARACKQGGIKPIFGAAVTVEGHPLPLLCASREGYANLCDLLTLAHATDRLQPALGVKQLEGHTEGLLCLTGDRHGLLYRGTEYPPPLAGGVRGGGSRAPNRRGIESPHSWLKALRRLFPDRLWVELTHHWRPGDGDMVTNLCRLAETHRLPVVATNAVRHAHAAQYALHDVLTCAGLGLTVGDAHPARPVNDQGYLRTAAEMAATGLPRRALANTEVVANMCDVDLLPEQVTPPTALLPEGVSAAAFLRELCGAALPRKYSGAARPRRAAARATMEHELGIIIALELEEFFLVVREIVEHARSCGIRCSGRGSAANSVVAYLLGITGVDPIQHHLLFERFLHAGRKGMPDIDVDFETHRRSEVIEWMIQRYGEQHTAMTANVVTFRLRLAVREIAKALGFPMPVVNELGKVLPHASAKHVRSYRDEIASVIGDSPALEVCMELVEALHNCPRHLSLHSGGMILSRVPLRWVSPIQTSANGVRQVQFNKDDVESLGLIKFDVLGLRTLSVVSEALEMLRLDEGRAPDLDNLPLDDDATFKLIRAGKTMSVFQIESPGQWNLISRSQPRIFDDLVAQVALFRPGPLQGNMVHPYVLRRRGLEPVTYLHPSLEPVLRDTYGVILYQEQVLEVAHKFAGLSLSEADEFRRLMSKFRSSDEMEGMRDRFLQGAISTHGVPPALANEVFDIVSKFVGYGFCRSHAAAFAQILYHTAYLKAHHPAAYMAGVLEHKPGFYPMNTVLQEARHCGVTVLPVDILRSDVKYRLEKISSHRGAGPPCPLKIPSSTGGSSSKSEVPSCTQEGVGGGSSTRPAPNSYSAIRVPLTQIKGMSPENAAAIVLERATRPFTDVEDLYRRVSLDHDLWDALARAGALDACGERRRVLWQLGVLGRRLGPSGSVQMALDPSAFPADAEPALACLNMAEITAWNFATQGLTTGPHPVALHRPYLDQMGVTPIGKMAAMKPGGRILTAGVVISRQRPPTGKGMCFIVLEDETGRLPTALTPPIFSLHQRELRESSLLIEGKLQGSGTGQMGPYRGVLVQRLWPLGGMLGHCEGGYSGHPGEMAR